MEKEIKHKVKGEKERKQSVENWGKNTQLLLEQLNELQEALTPRV